MPALLPGSSFMWFFAAALFEIAGCFGFWMWLRNDRSAWFILPAVAALILFALCLTRAETDHAGRAFAAYGGIYIAASMFWLMLIEGVRPDRWDLLGLVLAIAGTTVILFGPR